MGCLKFIVMVFFGMIGFAIGNLIFPVIGGFVLSMILVYFAKSAFEN